MWLVWDRVFVSAQNICVLPFKFMALIETCKGVICKVFLLSYTSQQVYYHSFIKWTV